MIAIISDIHGNYPALLSVLKEIDKFNCQIIVSLGDVAGYYCMINECINELRRRNIINILGNHDSYLLGYGQCPRSITVNRCISYQKEIITQENLNYLAASPITYELNNISMRHGGWNDPIDEYVKDFNFNQIKELPYNIYCSGHTHIQCLQESNSKQYFNPGSVGQPRDNNPLSGFAIIKNDSIYLKRVEYDINQISVKMKSCGFEPRIYENLYKGIKIGG